MRLFAVAFLCLLLSPIQAYNQPKPADYSAHPDTSQNGTQSSATVPQSSVGDQTQNKSGQDKSERKHGSLFDYLGVFLTVVIALAACIQAGVSIWQARVYERQYEAMNKQVTASNQSAEAALKGITALEKLERPFLMVELRGQDVWLVNVGKIPAQIIWHNPSGTLIFPDTDFEKLPVDYNYGVGYYEPNSEVFNVEWMAPKAERQLCYFDWLSIRGAIGPEMLNELNAFRRVILFLSAVKYRGMLSETVYESRWCYKWLGEKNGLRLGGPYGYNKYT
jgi:hypothetical protein